MRKILIAITFGLGIGLANAIVSSPTFAHHSTLMFDRSKSETIVGTITEFQWTNPHVIIWLNRDAEDDAEPVRWAIETSSPGNLRRVGWSKSSLTPGDRVSIDLNPLRSGQPAGRLLKATLLDTGEELSFGYLPEQLE